MFKLPDLPYGYGDLEPVISAETMALHHDKHHAGYVSNVNKLLEGADETPADLEAVVRRTGQSPDRAKLFDNAAQAWNHTFFWTCMSPERTQPSAGLAGAIERTFKDLEGLKQAFVKEGAEHFGSGWVWLAAEGDALKVYATHDADDALTHPGSTPLLVCDLWEHAYYLDHHNDRKGFLEAWFDALPDWDFAGEQHRAARGQGQAWRHPAPV